MNFQYYIGGIKSCKPQGIINLDRFLYAIKKPKKDVVFLCNEIQKNSENAKLKAELKCKLPYFTPCVIVEKWRKYENIVSFTGLLVVDFDNLEPDYAIEFRKQLFDEYKYIIASWISPSKKGVKCLINIPVSNNIDDFKSSFLAIEQELGVYYGFDTTAKNPVLPLFLSYDYDILIRDFPELFTKKYYLPKPVPNYIAPYFGNSKLDVIEKKVDSALSKITDAGHPILRAISYALGGYVGNGYLTESEAIIIINNAIDNHWYLKQKASTYKQTAATMISKGQNEPIELK
jgi:hypothetical protein